MTERKSILVFELWGLGDCMMASGFLNRLIVLGWEVSLLCKPASEELLRPFFPKINYIVFDAPWTRFYGKYTLWNWNWPAIARTVWSLARLKPDIVVSVRADPRDHLLMLATGRGRKIGFPSGVSRVLLTDQVDSDPGRHRVENWSTLAAKVFQCGYELLPPLLPSTDGRLLQPKTITLHTGARIQTRRWPTEYWLDIIKNLREEYELPICLISDPDGFGSDLAGFADTAHTSLSLSEMVEIFRNSQVVICNDSGPAHIAAALGVPVIAIFGPTNPDWFRPYGSHCAVVIRDICEYRPCFDYCHFPEPYCLTSLKPQQVWPEIRAFVDSLPILSEPL